MNPIRATTATNRLLAVVAVVALVAFLVLTYAVWHDVGPLAVDDRVADRIPRGSRDERELVSALSWPARPLAVLAGSLVLGAIAWARTRSVRVALFCAVVPLAVSITAEALKPVIDRRPFRSAIPSFPSGHATGITALAVVAWVTWISTWRSIAWRVLGALALCVLVAAVGVSRTWTGGHYATDVVGGVLLACAASLIAARLWLRAR